MTAAAAGTASNDNSADEAPLRQALAGGFRALQALPAGLESAYRHHHRERATVLLRRAIYGLFGLYLLVVLPIFLFSHDPAMPLWETYAMAPIGAVLALLWASTRVAALDAWVEAIISFSLFACLAGTLYCSMRLSGQYFGQMAAYETIYVLIVAFAILQLSPRPALAAALLAFAGSLLTALTGGLRPAWLDMLLYFAVPLLICAVTGYILDHSERRNFLQTLLLQRESQRLAQLHADAERNIREQRFTADFLTLISGNLAVDELLQRSLRFLVEQAGAQVGVAYHMTAGGRLRRLASWAVDADRLARGQELAVESTLMGPALRQDAVLTLQQVRADYLPLATSGGHLPTASLMVVPVTLAGTALAVLELGCVSRFAAEAGGHAEIVRRHLGYAITAANARALPAPGLPA